MRRDGLWQNVRAGSYLQASGSSAGTSESVNSAVPEGLKVLISAGPTSEPLDPVRYITNRSSGKMAYALANVALKAGAEVTLVSGPVTLAAPPNTELVKVETAAQMYEAVMSRASDHAIYIGAAAVADYSPATMEPEKIKKQEEQTTIILHKTKDIPAEVANLDKHPFTVGFAAETHDLEAYARDKLAQKKLDMIAANWVGRDLGGFDSEQNALHVFWENGEKTLAMMDKTHLSVAVYFFRVTQSNLPSWLLPLTGKVTWR